MSMKMIWLLRKRAFGSNSAIFNCSSTQAHKCHHPKSKIMVKKAELLLYFQQMTRIRKMESKIATAYKSGLVRGFCHLYDGQEAVAVGMEAALEPTDNLITAYRCHAQQLLRGDSLCNIFAELMGRKTGTNKGKGGSMHLYMPQNKFYGGNGIVGAHIPVGAGIAFASKYKKTSEVTVTLFGDGAANQGQVFEAANMAALWKLPLVFVIENNKYGMGTSIERSSFSSKFYTRGDYIPGIQCNGHEVISSRAAMEHAVDYCRKGNGPMFVEMLTYRYYGHSLSDPGNTYRNREEVKNFRKEKDALSNCKTLISQQGWASDEELKKIELEISTEVDSAFEQAKADSFPDNSVRFEDVYYEEKPSYIRATEKLNSFKIENFAI